jgi:prephenate dehydrogenase
LNFYLPAAVYWNKVTLIGVGLLGGSLGLALRKRRLAKRVVGCVRRDASVAECRRRRVAQEVTRDLAAAVADADLIILCTPIAQMRPLLERALPAIRRGAVITDVGSVKAGVVRELEALARRAGAQFVGSHPMAGGERMGVSASRADLFDGAVCVVTPTKHSKPAAVRKVEALWRDVGGVPLRLDARAHDRLVARSSHLPHVLAATLAGHVLDPKHGPDQPRLCANGFRDTTRVASGSPEMWRDIALANRANLQRSLAAVAKELGRFQRALAKGDERAVEAFFAQAKGRRDAWRSQAGRD